MRLIATGSNVVRAGNQPRNLSPKSAMQMSDLKETVPGNLAFLKVKVGNRPLPGSVSLLELNPEYLLRQSQ